MGSAGWCVSHIRQGTQCGDAAGGRLRDQARRAPHRRGYGRRDGDLAGFWQASVREKVRLITITEVVARDIRFPDVAGISPARTP